jgi:hypothetical protein
VGSGSAPSPLPFPAGGDNHRHLQKKKKRKQSFGSSSPFLDLLSSGFSLSLGSVIFLLQVIDPAVGLSSVAAEAAVEM